MDRNSTAAAPTGQHHPNHAVFAVFFPERAENIVGTPLISKRASGGVYPRRFKPGGDKPRRSPLFCLGRQWNQENAVFARTPQDALARRRLLRMNRASRNDFTRIKRQYDLFAARQLVAERLAVVGIERNGRQIFRNQFIQIHSRLAVVGLIPAEQPVSVAWPALRRVAKDWR